MANNARLKEHQLIASIRNGDKDALGKVYKSYRNPFILWALKYFNIQESDVLDIYQDVIIIFIKKINTEEDFILNCSIKTFLFAIGKNLILKKGHQQSKLKLYGEHDEFISDIINYDVIKEIELNEEQKDILKAINELGKKCQQILFLFYYRRFSIESIKNKLGYKNVDVVRTQKVRCMKSLKSIFLNKYKDIID